MAEPDTKRRKIDVDLEKEPAEVGPVGGEFWETLEHNGPLFPPPYEPLPDSVPFLYDGKVVKLPIGAEEIACAFASITNPEVTADHVFAKNFFEDFSAAIAAETPNHEISELQKCDFSLIAAHLEHTRTTAKQIPAEERQVQRDARAKAEEKYRHSVVDGEEQLIDEFRIEPPRLFRGRGDHPLRGKFKRRIWPEDVTLNLGETAAVPSPSLGPDHSWKSVVHNHGALWLASYVDPLTAPRLKYVFFSASSSMRARANVAKFETARKLKLHIDNIRTSYKRELRSASLSVRQRATALYLVDILSLRPGHTKDSKEEADTVGALTLLVGNVSFQNSNEIVLDFLGKDSVRYFHRVTVPRIVYLNLTAFTRSKKAKDRVFDLLQDAALNQYLQNYDAELTAKVFRTHNASRTMQRVLQKLERHDGLGTTVQTKLVAFERANRTVAVLCNHQRSVSAESAEKGRLRLDELKWRLYRLERRLQRDDPEYVVSTVVDAEEFRRVAAAAAANHREPADTAAALNEELDSGFAKFSSYPPMPASKPKLMEAIIKARARLASASMACQGASDGAVVSLSTSKENYIDPRISVAFSKRHDVPLNRLFRTNQLQRFQWALDVNADWEF